MSGTVVSDARRTTQLPSRWSSFFSGEKCSIVCTSRSPTTRSASPRRIGATSLGMSARVVLVVGVGVDDHVRAQLQRRVEARLEALREPLVVREPHDVVDAVGAGDLDRAVGGAVVDDEPLDLVEALDLAREVGKRDRERLLLVEAGNLDDQLHRMGVSRCVNWAASLSRKARRSPRPALRGASALDPRWKAQPSNDPRPGFRALPGARLALPCRHPRRCGRSSALCVLAVVGFFTWVTYPNYDSYYSLLWGQEVLSTASCRASRPTARPRSTRWRSCSAPRCRCSARAPTG